MSDEPVRRNTVKKAVVLLAMGAALTTVCVLGWRSVQAYQEREARDAMERAQINQFFELARQADAIVAQDWQTRKDMATTTSQRAVLVWLERATRDRGCGQANGHPDYEHLTRDQSLRKMTYQIRQDVRNCVLQELGGRLAGRNVPADLIEVVEQIERESLAQGPMPRSEES